MSLKYIFKLTTLLAALSATVYAIYLLNTGHSSDFMTSLGFGSHGQTLNWCSNRVSKIEAATGKWKLEEIDRKWTVSLDGAEPQRLDYLEIEKWFASYCILHIELYRSENILDQRLEPFATVHFNDGKTAKIFRLGEDAYHINEVIFKSKEFNQALIDLQSLLKF